MIRRLLPLIALLAALAPWAAPVWAAPASHELLLTLQPDRHRLHGRDRITPAPDHTGELLLRLAQELQVEEVSADGRPLPYTRERDTLRLRLPPEAKTVSVSYSGRLDRDEPPRIAPQGSWLPGDFDWFPRMGDTDPVELTVLTPPGQHAVLTGTLLRESAGPDGVRATFRTYPGAPAELFAGPRAPQERLHRGLRLRAYFPEEARALAPAYLDDVARHIERFAEIIGPYPYGEFSVVAGPDPVGLGYPGLTYVSEKILHLPFMRAQSLAHEILHVWWGNAVRVDAGSGNWAEGLTTYMADYAGSDPAGRERMRREWLRDYAALPGAEDHPLSRFRGKLHARDQVVGYGKAAFVFHMLERRIGTEAFRDGLARFYAAQRGKEAGWSELQAAFEAASGENLDRFFRQWVARTGAPALALEEVEFREAGVRLTLAQAGEPYELQVPVVIETAQGRETHVVPLDDARRTVEIATRARPQALQADPQQQLFRRLAAGETVPVLRDLMLSPQAQTVLVSVPQEAAGTARRLGERLLQGAAPPIPARDRDRGRPALVIGIGTPQAVAAAAGLPRPPLPAQQGSAFVWASQDAGAPTVGVAAADPAALEALVRPLPHHGRESWLLFQGSRAVERGVWPPGPASALTARR